MNGQIDAKSTINIGTTIRIDLPLKSSQSFKKDTDNKLTSAKKNQFKHLNILVAEDNAVNRSVIKGLLTNLQITPDICNDGKEALDKFKSNKGKYDLILMDCDMPVMNGFNASRQIRSLNCAHPNLAIAAVTAHALNEFRQKASDCGMNYYLTKPIRLNDLTELLVKVSSPN
jgi:CheY-like chemotaxis protein